nr:MAG TPA: hypothetical protein [Caudoviricetes sp.]
MFTKKVIKDKQCYQMLHWIVYDLYIRAKKLI